MANRKKCLVDTSVIIPLFRGNETVKNILETLIPEEIFICDITMLEVLAGCSTVEKRDNAIGSLEAFGYLPTDERVSGKALQLMKRYCIQRGQPLLMLPDCLIAAHALAGNMELLTFNKKDFDFIHGIDIHSLSK
jgi:predicted nucleic acid-binding protein